MKKILMGALMAASTAGLAQADGHGFSYSTELSINDAFNSRGVPLEGWCALLQQDRANWHRFNKRDQYDEGDPFFDSPKRRAMMEGKCVVSPNSFTDPGAQIRSGNRQFDLTIQVFTSGGQVTQIRFGDRF